MLSVGTPIASSSNPIRPEILFAEREEGRGDINLPDIRPNPFPSDTTAPLPAFWTEGRLRLRLISPRGERTIAIVNRPFALIGRSSAADLPVPSREASLRHVYLHLDRRGVFAVDLVSRTGTRFDDASFGSRSSWVRAGRGLEVAGFRIEVIEAETSGDPHAPALGVDPLAEQTGLCPVELGLGDETVQPLSLLSELTFLGRSRACAIRVEGEDVARVHALIVRSSDKAFLVNLAGPGLTINGEPATLSAPLRDGDRLGIGQARLLVHLRDIRRNGTGSQEVAAMPTSWASPSAIHASDPIRPATPNALRVAPGGQKELTLTNDQFRHSLITAVRQLCQEQSALFERHLARLDRLQHEVAELRAELRERLGSPSLPPAGGVPTALSSPPLPTPEVPLPDPGRATSWLIDRLGELEAQVDHESRSGWRDLLSRIGSPLRARDDS